MKNATASNKLPVLKFMSDIAFWLAALNAITLGSVLTTYNNPQIMDWVGNQHDLAVVLIFLATICPLLIIVSIYDGILYVLKPTVLVVLATYVSLAFGMVSALVFSQSSEYDSLLKLLAVLVAGFGLAAVGFGLAARLRQLRIPLLLATLAGFLVASYGLQQFIAETDGIKGMANLSGVVVGFVMLATFCGYQQIRRLSAANYQATAFSVALLVHITFMVVLLRSRSSRG